MTPTQIPLDNPTSTSRQTLLVFVLAAYLPKRRIPLGRKLASKVRITMKPTVNRHGDTLRPVHPKRFLPSGQILMSRSQ